MVIMDWINKVADWIMPPGDEEVEEVTTIEKKTEEKSEAKIETSEVAENNVKRAASAGGSSYVASGNVAAQAGSVNYSAYTDTVKTDRPNLKIIKAPSFVMKVYKPENYDNVKAIADDILSHKAVVINYEYVQVEQQRRICDHLDGVCYAIDGVATKISEKIFLYTPEGINTSDIAALVASVRYH